MKICVGSDDINLAVGYPRCESAHQGQGIGFLTAGATDAPDVKSATIAGRYLLLQSRQELMLEMQEDALIAIEARDSDTT
jgi:hypothetical protein